MLAHNDLRKVLRVLDVGCGPGTNTKYFNECAYVGIDLNQRYIETARRKHSRDFQTADARFYSVDSSSRYDFILINSFLHHLQTSDVRNLLANLAKVLTVDGHIHILELVLPASRSIARRLAHWDRGKFARPLEEWRNLLISAFEPVIFEPYPLTLTGVTLWNMVYFKGRIA